MIIYGTKAAKLIVEPISDVCPNCGVKHTMDMHIFQRYKHIMLLPLFPTRKTGASQCNHCLQVLRRKDMPESIRQTYIEVKKQATMPVWTWAGVALVLMFLILSAFSE